MKLRWLNILMMLFIKTSSSSLALFVVARCVFERGDGRACVRKLLNKTQRMATIVSTTQLREFVTALPPTTKMLLVASLVLSTFEIFWWQMVLRAAAAPANDGTTTTTPWSLLQLQPSSASSLWTLVTAPLVETNLLILFGNLLALLAAGRYFEPVWGSLEFARFVVGVNGIAHLALLATCIFLVRHLTEHHLLVRHIHSWSVGVVGRVDGGVETSLP
jgi:membrane associated rhomboid family serine protease